MSYTLYMSLRSPFARRVRLALEVLAQSGLGLSYSTETIDVFNPPAWYSGINPLSRVPVLKTPEGELIIDSWQILNYLQARDPSHPLFLFGGAREARARTLSGAAVGIMEHVVGIVLERARGETLAHHETIDDYTAVIHRGLVWCERELGARSNLESFALDQELRLCDLDLGSSFAYAELRMGSEVLKPYPVLKSYLKILNSLPAFQKTAPPGA